MPGLEGNTKETSGATEISEISKHREALDIEIKIEQLRDQREETEDPGRNKGCRNTKPHRRLRACGRVLQQEGPGGYCPGFPGNPPAPSEHPPSEGPGHSNS